MHFICAILYNSQFVSILIQPLISIVKNKKGETNFSRKKYDWMNHVVFIF